MICSNDNSELACPGQTGVLEMQPGRRWLRVGFLLAGIFLGQAILYAPSLVGLKVLLPLDILAEGGAYLPRSPEFSRILAQDLYLEDLILRFEPERRFAAAEFRAGRLPMWIPNQFAGAPFVWPKFSPFLFLESLTESPLVLAWVQVLTAMVAGVGAYVFCRKAVGVGFWPAAVVAWCYPLSGFFVLWQGYPVILSAYWLPWAMLVVDQVVRAATFRTVAALGFVTGLVLVSGQLDVAGQVLLAAGMFALWRFGESHWQRWLQRPARRVMLGLVAGWLLGFLLATPHLLPLLEYAQTGTRMVRRSGGEEERPPVGLSELTKVVLPDAYGSTARDSLRIESGQATLLERSAGAYVGVVATLFAAPLAWWNRSQRRSNWFWLFLGLFGLSWSLDLPLFVDLLRLPGLNMMSHNRLVFVSAFAFLVSASLGLDALWKSKLQWRSWLWLPAATLGGLCLWCAYRAVSLPEQLATQIPNAVRQGNGFGNIQHLDNLHQVQDWFSLRLTVAAALCGTGVLAWLWLRFRSRWQSHLFPIVAAILFGDLLWFAHGRNPQCDPALYFPAIPVLEQVASAGPGRVIGHDCLPASLATICRLRDVRGYDAVDPARLVEVLALGAESRPEPFAYAVTQWMNPKMGITPEGSLKCSPVIDMLGVRYVIFRGSPPPKLQPQFQGEDYWVMVNSNALPRVFVPNQVESVADNSVRLYKLAAPEFDARAVAYVESAVDLPDLCHGTAEIVDEIPTRVTISVQMETPGLVVLADQWDKGWRAYLSGKRVPILRTNHAIRGVVAPAGPGTLEFRYEPDSFALGLGLAAFSAGVLLVGLAASAWQCKASSNTLVRN